MFEPLTSASLLPILVAPFVGSFLGVLIKRLSEGAPVIIARSACPACGSALRPAELVPLVSFLLLRGRCRHCRQPISRFHPAVEIAAIAVALWSVLAGTDTGLVWADCALGWTLLCLAWIDWTAFLLPDVLTLPLLLAGLMLTMVWFPNDLTEHCVAAILAYLSFEGLNFTYRRMRGRDGLGGGDSKLIAAAGAWCGLTTLPLIVLGSALTGLLAALALALAGRTVTPTTRIPFGPCIAVAFWLAWLYGSSTDDLIHVIGRS